MKKVFLLLSFSIIGPVYGMQRSHSCPDFSSVQERDRHRAAMASSLPKELTRPRFEVVDNEKGCTVLTMINLKGEKNTLSFGGSILKQLKKKRIGIFFSKDGNMFFIQDKDAYLVACMDFVSGKYHPVPILCSKANFSSLF